MRKVNTQKFVWQEPRDKNLNHLRTLEEALEIMEAEKAASPGNSGLMVPFCDGYVDADMEVHMSNGIARNSEHHDHASRIRDTRYAVSPEVAAYRARGEAEAPEEPETSPTPPEGS